MDKRRRCDYEPFAYLAVVRCRSPAAFCATAHPVARAVSHLREAGAYRRARPVHHGRWRAVVAVVCRDRRRGRRSRRSGRAWLLFSRLGNLPFEVR